MLSILFTVVVLVSGCSQEKTGKPQVPVYQSPTQAAAATPTQISAAGDVLGSELAQADILESDLTDPSLDQLNSDLAEVEAGL